MTTTRRMLQGLLCTAMLGAQGLLPALASAQGPACSVDYKINGQFPSGFNVTVTMSNPTATPIAAWRLTWTMPGDERVVDLFNGTFTQTGAAVSVIGESYNSTIPARGSVVFGFNGGRVGPAGVPAAFRINDMSCSGGTGMTGTVPNPTPSPSPTPTGGLDDFVKFLDALKQITTVLAALGSPKPPPPPPAPVSPLNLLTEFNGSPLTLLAGLPPKNSPTNNSNTRAKEELGKLLFFDTRLSMGGQFSCAVCHMPEKGWGDGFAVSTRDNATVNTRHSPTLFNVFYGFPFYYWDGRQPTLEAVSNAAWTGQMGGVPDKVAATLDTIPEYKQRFTQVFGSGPTGLQIPMALAAFIRTIQSGDSPWDRFLAGDRTAVSPDAVAGEAIFRRSNCTNCHVPPLYSDYKFHNIGVGIQGVAMPDQGRGKISMNAAENGAFKTPTLRGVALHPPHFHDGSAKTLEAAVDFMLAGGYRGPDNPNIDVLLKPSTVTPTERANLLAFLRALSGTNRPFTRPTPPPSPTMGGGVLTAKQLYEGMCSVCHGVDGKGVGGFPDVTVASLQGSFGTRALLIDKIARTMPTSRPGSCTGTCAEQIADYIRATFPGTTMAGSGGTGGGTGGGTTPGGGGTTPGGGTTTPGGGTGGTGGTTPPPVVCNGETPGPRVLRLLTRREYENTVMDLLGVSSPFSFGLPAAARVLGYDNNTELNVITARHIDGYLQTAQDLATRALQNQRGRLVPCDPNANATGCAQQIVRDLGKRAYRRPLDQTEQAQLVALFSGVSFDEGVKRAVTAMLVSPNFLYRTEIGTPQGNGTSRLTQYEIATALSYLFWGTMPDAALFTAADQNALQTPESLVTQANRLLADAKAKRQIGVFAGQWLGADPIDSGDKNPRVYPDYTRAVQDATDAELVAFVNHVIFNGTGKFPELFNANYVFANQPLAAYYGLQPVNGNTPQQVPVTDGTRGGLLGLGSVLASFAQADDTSPVRRGVFVRRSLLCQTLPPPPPAINNAPPPLDPKLTTRARFAAHSSEPFCASCHQYFDDIGFGLERYDGAGKLRSVEAGVPIDDAGKIVSPENLDTSRRPVPAGVPFKGLRQLSTIVGGSADAPKCLATQYFRYARGNEETTTDQCTVQALYNRFQASGFDLKTLLIGIVQSPTFTTRR